jgi:hypothetical protein
MEKEITDLFREKTFHELNEQERVQLSELCENEDEFEQMRNLFVGIEAMKREEYTPKAETKASLDAIFASQTRNRTAIWYNSVLVMLYPVDKPIQRRPLIQIAAAVVLLLVTIPFFTSDRIDSTSPQVAQVKQETIKKKRQENTTVETSDERSSSENKTLGSEGSKGDFESTVLKEDEALMVPASREAVSSGALAEDLGAAMPMSSIEKSEARVADKDFDHPDGVFSGTVISYSKSVKQQPAILDLLTATF